MDLNFRNAAKQDMVFGDGPVAKAYLIYLTNDESEKKKEKIPVQFNPEKLSVSPLMVIVDFDALFAVNVTSILSVKVVPLSLSAVTDAFFSVL